jgi:hypothetical protein
MALEVPHDRPVQARLVGTQTDAAADGEHVALGHPLTLVGPGQTEALSEGDGRGAS